MALHDLLTFAAHHFPEAASAAGTGLIAWGAGLHREKVKARAEARNVLVTEEGLDRRQLLHDAALMLDEQRALNDEQRRMVEEQRSSKAQIIADNTVLVADNRQMAAAIDEYREAQKDKERRIQEIQDKVQTLQTKIQSVYEQLARAAASSQCADCPLLLATINTKNAPATVVTVSVAASAASGEVAAPLAGSQ